MSYDLRVWEHHGTEPASFEAATQTLLALERLRPGQNPKFVALGQQLAARFPQHRCGDAGDAAVWAFALPPDDRVPLLQFVVEAANALGLVVLDDQLGIAFLPSGAVREMGEDARGPSDQQAADAGLSDDPSQALARAHAAIEPGLASLLRRHGFEPQRRELTDQWVAEFTRPAQGGRQHVEMTAYFTRYGDFSWLLTFRSRMDDVHGVLQACLDADRLSSGAGDLVFHPRMIDRSVRPADLSVASDADIGHLLSWIEAVALPVLNQALTCAGALSLMRDPTPRNLPEGAGEPNCFADLFQSYGFAPLVSAWLHDRPSFDAIAAAYAEPGFRVTRYWSQAELAAVLEHIDQQQAEGSVPP